MAKVKVDLILIVVFVPALASLSPCMYLQTYSIWGLLVYYTHALSVDDWQRQLGMELEGASTGQFADDTHASSIQFSSIGSFEVEFKHNP